MRTNTLVILPLALMLLLSACIAPAALPTPAPSATLRVPTQTVAPTQIPAGNAEESAAAVMVEVSGVAQDITSQVVAAVPPSTDGPWWETMPQFTLLTLQGYPIAKHRMEPQIFVYSAKDLGVNEAAGKVVESLQSLLKNRQAGQSLPYLPLSNEAQALHAQVKYLDFKNGSSVCFLTESAQGIVPVNNRGLVYTCQGLTSDGSYYVAAVLPVYLPELPADEASTGNLPADFMNDFPKYLADTVAMLDQQPASAFTPDLDKLDALMQSIEIK